MKNVSFNKSEGFSLIELLLVLAIIAALAVAAFIIYPRVQAGRQATYETQVLSSAQAGIKALYTSGNFFALDNTVANQADFFPASMDGTGAVITNQFGGAVTVEGSTPVGVAKNTTPASNFRIQYASVPSEVCIKMAASAAQNFTGVYVGGVVLDAVGTITVKNGTTGVITESAIPTGCTSAANVNMTFVSN